MDTPKKPVTMVVRRGLRFFTVGLAKEQGVLVATAIGVPGLAAGEPVALMRHEKRAAEHLLKESEAAHD